MAHDHHHSRPVIALFSRGRFTDAVAHLKGRHFYLVFRTSILGFYRSPP
jgi:hypothetical protein